MSRSRWCVHLTWFTLLVQTAPSRFANSIRSFSLGCRDLSALRDLSQHLLQVCAFEQK